MKKKFQTFMASAVLGGIALAASPAAQAQYPVPDGGSYPNKTISASHAFTYGNGVVHLGVSGYRSYENFTSYSGGVSYSNNDNTTTCSTESKAVWRAPWEGEKYGEVIISVESLCRNNQASPYDQNTYQWSHLAIYWDGHTATW